MSSPKHRQALALLGAAFAGFGLLGVAFLVNGMSLAGEWLITGAMVVGACGAVTFFVLGMQTQKRDPKRENADTPDA